MIYGQLVWCNDSHFIGQNRCAVYTCCTHTTAYSSWQYAVIYFNLKWPDKYNLMQFKILYVLSLALIACSLLLLLLVVVVIVLSADNMCANALCIDGIRSNCSCVNNKVYSNNKTQYVCMCTICFRRLHNFVHKIYSKLLNNTKIAIISHPVRVAMENESNSFITITMCVSVSHSSENWEIFFVPFVCVRVGFLYEINLFRPPFLPSLSLSLPFFTFSTFELF